MNDASGSVGAATSLRVALLSDLHIYEDADEGVEPSLVQVSQPESEVSKHPIAGLRKLITDDDLTADVLVCCGDLGDKASPGGVKYAWQQLHDLKARLSAEMLLATAGNHDMDSRYLHSDFDAKGNLLDLTPGFPFDDDALSDMYWARNFAIVQWRDVARFVVLNTAAYHGYTEEFRHGRIAERTVSRLLTLITDQGRRSINILVCHHHPHRFGDIDAEDYSQMEGADHLLQELDSHMLGPWIVLHGHQHFPRLGYAGGGATSPIIFSSGSLCAVLHAEIQSRARNQFYVLNFPLEAFTSLELSLGGTFRAWDWNHGVGWQPAQRSSGLPAVGGFGYRQPYDVLAGKVKDAFDAVGAPWATWPEILSSLPGLDYLLPRDLEQLLSLLKEEQNLATTFDAYGRPAQIGSL